MTTIRHLGVCPCPRCMVKMSKVYLIGTKTDRKNRTELRRIDDQKRQNAIQLARKAIYEGNDTIDSTYVERQLKDLSWVPTSVSLQILISHDTLHLPLCLECILWQALTISSWFFHLVPCGSDARVRDWRMEIHSDTPSPYTTKHRWKSYQWVW